MSKRPKSTGLVSKGVKITPKLVLQGIGIVSVLSLIACQPVASQKDDRLYIDLGDAEDYAYWLEEERDEEPPIPFDAEPLVVTGKGKVKAVPDIAVITADIISKNTNESVAFNEVSETVNAIQAAIKDYGVETGFTTVKSASQFDEICQYENRVAQQRHAQIFRDYYFNKRLDDQGDTKTKRREPKARLKQRICRAQDIEVSTKMVIRLSPPDKAGAVLQSVSNAGATRVRLYGYDFKNYDALYQEAASLAVAQAKQKAEMIARITKAELDGLVGFNVGKPVRTGRFGPQPAIVNKSGRRSSAGFSGSAVYAESVVVQEASTYMDGEDEIVVTGSRRLPPNEAYQNRVDDETDDDFAPVSTSNALNLSLLSGAQTITVSAILRYDYKTVIDGTIAPSED